MKILLAVDGSVYSDEAVDELCERRWPPGSEIRIITVDPPLEQNMIGGSPTVFDELIAEQQRASLQRVGEAATKLREKLPETAIVPILRNGRPKDAILDEADTWGADLVVVGSHGHGAIKRAFLGSVSLAVATGAPCSVLIVRRRSTE